MKLRSCFLLSFQRAYRPDYAGWNASFKTWGLGQLDDTGNVLVVSVQWVCLCSGCVSAVGVSVQWVCLCSGCVSAVGVSVQWVCQCSGCVSAVGVSVQWVWQCSGCVSAVGVSVYVSLHACAFNVGAVCVLFTCACVCVCVSCV